MPGDVREHGDPPVLLDARLGREAYAVRLHPPVGGGEIVGLEEETHPAGRRVAVSPITASGSSWILTAGAAVRFCP